MFGHVSGTKPSWDVHKTLEKENFIPENVQELVHATPKKIARLIIFQSCQNLGRH